MALVIEGEERVAASINKVWQALNDPEVLKACIPGCQSLEKKSDTEMAATVVLKIGPIKATFAGEVTLKTSTRRIPTRSRAKVRAASPASPRAAPTSP